MNCYQIKELTFAYPLGRSKALEQINLSVAKGEFVVFCGKTGSGKSTLLRHLKTVLTPHGERQGEVYFEGAPLGGITRREQSARIGFVLQNPDNQIVTDKVWHELAFGLESLGADNSTIRLRVAEMASYFGIQGWFDRNVSELSGGQKQLLNLASIMAMQPSVLILDEPTSQLDPIAAADFLGTVKKINRELGTTVLITEHRLEEVFPAADRAVVMDQGRIIADGPPQQVAEILKKGADDMFAAMPAPMQLYAALDSDLPCPVTVRDARNWLSALMGDRPVFADAVPERGAEEEAKDYALECRELWFKYDRDLPDVITGLNLKVPRGLLYCIVGGNATGKSTMLTLLCGLNRPYRGKVLLNGKDVARYKPAELFSGLLAVLPQNPQALFVKKTVRQDLLEIFRGSRLPREEQEKKVEEMAALTEIEDLLEMHPYDLSGGEQQKAALAKVLLLEPQILLLDEPTKGLDSYFKARLADIFKKLNERGVTVLMVSHDIEFCGKYADICALFFNGHVVTTGGPNRFFSGNSFYTTIANRLSRHLFANAVTTEEVINLCRQNLQGQGGEAAAAAEEKERREAAR